MDNNSEYCLDEQIRGDLENKKYRQLEHKIKQDNKYRNPVLRLLQQNFKGLTCEQNEQEIDIQAILDIVVAIIQNNHQQLQFTENNLLESIIKHFIAIGQAKYVFIFYHLKLSQISQPLHRLKWLLSSWLFIPYFNSSSNNTIVNDYNDILKQLSDAYKGSIQQNLQLLNPNQQHSEYAKAIQSINNQYEWLIVRALKQINTNCIQSWYNNVKLYRFISTIVPSDLLCINKSSQIYTQIVLLIKILPIQAFQVRNLKNMPKIILLHILQICYSSLYNIFSPKILYLICLILQQYLPNKAQAKHPFENSYELTQKQMNKLIRIFCISIQKNQIWFNFKMYVQNQLYDMRDILRRLVIYLGFISPKYDQQLYRLIKTALLQNKIGPIINRIVLIDYCLKSCIDLNESLQYRIFIINQYRNIFLEMRNQQLSMTDLNWIVQVTYHMLENQIQFTDKSSNTNHIGYVISFLMNFIIVVCSKTCINIEKKSKQFLNKLKQKVSAISQVLERELKKTKSQNQTDQIQLCKMRIQDLNKMFDKYI